MAWKKIATVGKVASKWFFWKIFFIFLIIFVLHVIVISIQERSVEPIFREIGGRLFQPTLKLQEYSEKAIEQGGLYERDEESFYRGAWKWFLDSSSFFISFYMIFLWWKLFYFIFDKISNINPIINSVLAAGVFFVTQIIFLLVFTPESVSGMSDSQLMMIPLRSFGSFFKAVPYFFKPVTELAKKVIGDVQNTTPSLNNLTNSL